MQKNINVRSLESHDLNLLAEFLSTNATPKYSTDKYKLRFNFWWYNNPAFRRNDQMGWIIEDLSCSNYIKGFLGNIPTEYKFKSKILRAVVPSTWLVQKNYRKYSIALLFAFLRQKKDIFIISRI